MSDAAGRRKRFYREVAIASVAASPGSSSLGGFGVTLDGRGMRTPAKRQLAVPTSALAEAIAEEWRAQGDFIEPGRMHLTRIVNSALDGVAGRAVEVRAAIVAYGGNDLLCYLAEAPRELIERQSQAWGPVHAWIKQAFGIELVLAAGIMPVEQDATALARLDTALGERTPLELAALHVTTSAMGSLFLSLAVLHRRLSPQEAWALAHIDEDYQIEQWGHDTEAVERRARGWSEVAAACRILALCRI